MKLVLRVFAICCAVFLSMIALPRLFRAWASCPTYPVDVSTVVQHGTVDNCGETIWELRAWLGAYIFDEGPYDGIGTCTGGYQNCNCGTVAVSFKSPTKNLEFMQVAFPPDQPEYQFWWNVTNYLQPILNGCTSGNCESTGYSSETDQAYVDSGAGWDDEVYTPCNF